MAKVDTVVDIVAAAVTQAENWFCQVESKSKSTNTSWRSWIGWNTCSSYSKHSIYTQNIHIYIYMSFLFGQPKS